MCHFCRWRPFCCPPFLTHHVGGADEGRDGAGRLRHLAHDQPIGYFEPIWYGIGLLKKCPSLARTEGARQRAAWFHRHAG